MNNSLIQKEESQFLSCFNSIQRPERREELKKELLDELVAICKFLSIMYNLAPFTNSKNNLETAFSDFLHFREY